MAECWRFWMILPGTDVLASPLMTDGPVQEWPTRFLRAQCRLPHMPPAPYCRCGIYADRTAEQAHARMEHWRRTFGTWLPMAEPGAPPVCAVGRIALVGAVEYEAMLGPDAPASWAHLCYPLGEGHRELRGRSAEIIELYLYDDDRKLAAQLTERYQVPVAAL